MTTKPKSYVICGTPRSGSTMLCRMLAESGVAGAPHSYFREADVAEWADRWDVDLSAGTETAEFDRNYLAALIRAGSAGTERLGLRVMYSSLEDARRRINRALGREMDVVESLTQAFGPLVFIHLSRQDKLGQAVSLARAEQTGLWHLRADGSVLEGSEDRPEPVYDAERINAILHELEHDDRAWHDFFAARSIDPLRLTYETLTAAPQAELGRIFLALGLDPLLAADVAVPTAKMADGVSAEWVARFRGSRASA